MTVSVQACKRLYAVTPANTQKTLLEASQGRQSLHVAVAGLWEAMMASESVCLSVCCMKALRFSLQGTQCNGEVVQQRAGGALL